MTNSASQPSRSETRTRNMLIRRARELEGRWETVCETLILFIGTLQDTDLHHGDNFGQMLEEIEEVIADIPMREEWTQLHLFKLCSIFLVPTSTPSFLSKHKGFPITTFILLNGFPI